MKKFLLVIALLCIMGCNGQDKKQLLKPVKMENTEKVTFGGGCFWCVESCFNLLKGVESAVSGYSGGTTRNPTYEEVCSGKTGHAEVVEITYNPDIISYAQLMDVFFFLHDATQLNRQGNDIGTQYRSVVFYRNDEQKKATEEALKLSENTTSRQGKYVTEIVPFEKFWPAELYHQGYYNANPNQPYCSAVVGPKIAKFKQHYGAMNMLKSE